MSQYVEIQWSIYLHGNSGVEVYGRSSGVQKAFLSYHMDCGIHCSLLLL